MEVKKTQKIKKEDRIGMLMYRKACILANKPVTELNIFDVSYHTKNSKNTCNIYHAFKSTSSTPQSKLTAKKRQESAHNCQPSCPGFTHCLYVKVFYGVSSCAR